MSKRMYDMNVAELQELIGKLKDTIRKNPKHSRIEQVELEDAEQLLRERKLQEAETDDGGIVV